MRFVLATAACMAAVSFATAASAGDGDCHATQRSERGEVVTVSLQVKDGKTAYSVVRWYPVLAQPGAQERSPLQISYGSAGASGQGEPNRVSASILIIGKNIGFDGASVALASGERRWQAPLQTFGLMAQTPGADSMISGEAVLDAKRTGTEAPAGSLLTAIGAAGPVKLTVLDKDGREVAGYDYDLSRHAERDAMFLKAWTEAQAWAAGPDPCD